MIDIEFRLEKKGGGAKLSSTQGFNISISSQLLLVMIKVAAATYTTIRCYKCLF
ncbi:hypothetical protein MKW98_026419, partial [Papaver atlanticum]